ncbi:MAG TPA: class III extradiol dioxygenase subunit B-like domain-containing protein [Blastocatellia bacterium]|nr:class III extradiol dioxygenase subunit B-like domain-containing protein [Blastocatellia bacterium]
MICKLYWPRFRAMIAGNNPRSVSLNNFSKRAREMINSVVFSGIAPHPPLLVPEVGGDRIRRVADSQRSLAEFSRRLVDSKPETVVVISPHSPSDPITFTARSTKELRGDFHEFNAPDVKLAFLNDLELIKAITATAREEGVELKELTRDHPLDHGALVPLYYLREAGWTGPAAVFGFTEQSNDAHLAFGRAIARGAASIKRRVALVASGDLSHRLIVGGPYEFEPTAHLFDEQIVSAIASGDAHGVLDVEPTLRSCAGECGYRSIVIALGCVGDQLTDHQVLSYEGPFGVGYMVAVLHDANR